MRLWTRSRLAMAVLLAALAMPLSAQAVELPGPLVSAEWLNEHLDEESLVVVHVARDAYSFAEGHVSGARMLLWEDLVVSRDGVPNEMPSVEALTGLVRSLGIDRSNSIVIYDEGVGMLATRAFLTFDYLGLGEQTALLDGHWNYWSSQPYPVGKGMQDVEPSSFEPEVNESVLISMQRLEGILGEDGVQDEAIVLDNRPARQYDKGWRVEGGILPGALNHDWQDYLQSKEMPLLVDRATLQAQFDKIGAGASKPVVTYCVSGVQACYGYFIARYLDIPTQVYDGSLSEWRRQHH